MLNNFSYKDYTFLPEFITIAIIRDIWSAIFYDLSDAVDIHTALD